MKRAQYRIEEREKKAQAKAKWDAGLPERLAVFQEQFIAKRCVLGRGRAVFQGFIVKAFHEFCSDSKAVCRAPTNEEIARAEADARKRGDRFYKYPGRAQAIPLPHHLRLESAELESTILDLSGVEADEGPNVHGNLQPTYVGLNLKDAFAYPNCEPEHKDIHLTYPSRAWVAVS